MGLIKKMSELDLENNFLDQLIAGGVIVGFFTLAYLAPIIYTAVSYHAKESAQNNSAIEQNRNACTSNQDSISFNYQK
ncbi:hypothetical protein HYT23_04940 [Candidatus Pacearchaeota archaeon]|nr:hypothetical protein [Candidatus Pacearchaeota archaeon]